MDGFGMDGLMDGWMVGGLVDEWVGSLDGWWDG